MAPQAIPQTFTTRDLQRKYRAIIDTARETRDAVVLINNSQPEAVLLDIETYQQLVADNYLFDVPDTLKRVQEAERSYLAGKARELRSWNELD